MIKLTRDLVFFSRYWFKCVGITCLGCFFRIPFVPKGRKHVLELSWKQETHVGTTYSEFLIFIFFTFLKKLQDEIRDLLSLYNCDTILNDYILNNMNERQSWMVSTGGFGSILSIRYQLLSIFVSFRLFA